MDSLSNILKGDIKMEEKLLYMSQPTYTFIELAERTIGYSKVTAMSEVTYVYVHFDTIYYDRMPNLKAIICPCTGIKHLDVAKAESRGIKIFYLDDPQFLFRDIWGTAYWTLYHILALLMFNKDDIADKTIGIIGMGRVGQQLYKLLLQHRCKFMFNDAKEMPLMFPNSPLEELCKRSDIITLHVNENESTIDLIDDKMFHIMESKNYIINSSRSSILNGNALLDAWNAGVLNGVALDVIESYTEEIKSELYMLNAHPDANFMVDSHVAGKTFKSAREATDKWVLEKFLEWRKENGA